METTLRGPYRIGRLLGRGASSDVYEARDERDGARVALKVLHEQRVQPEELTRQLEISRAVGSPHVVRAIALADGSGAPGLVLELIDGRPLRDVLRAGPLPWEQACVVALDVAAGLDAIHRAHHPSGYSLGLLHGDVSTGNVLVGRDGVVRLTDLGIARRRLLSVHTARGAVSGTPGYIAPEVIRGRPPGHQADLFGLGAVLQEAVSGQPAFDGPDDAARIRATVESVLQVPESPLAPLIAALTRKRPEKRPPSAGRVMEAVRTIAPDLQRARAELGQRAYLS